MTDETNDQSPIEQLELHRLSIAHDGVEIMGVTVTCRRPENHDQMTELIRELLAVMEAPTVGDNDILGWHSPSELAISTLEEVDREN